MELGDQRESRNIEDRRGQRGGQRGGIGRPIAVGGGIGTVLLVVVALFLGIDPRALIGDGGAPTQVSQQQQMSPAEQEGQRRFVAQVLATTEDVWGNIFRAGGKRYEPPNLVLFSGVTQSGCGTAQAATGPFYCPLDQKVYLDLAFFRDMERKLGAPGEFARAYVVAHEIGHHVQNQLGVLQQVERMRRGMSEAESNQLQVRVELQADCFAGVWANNAQRSRPILDERDIESGMNAAAAVGDDRLQRRSQGVVVPESFTHGSSAQRMRWFRIGLESGDIRKCDTFGPDRV
jgi:predicted metalloprotease